jgi:poly [ADP-ribose] polymerase
MAHTIEIAKSGRASCRTCRNPIAKGELRFGEEVANAFGDAGDMSYRWHHLKCAAGALPNELRSALDAYDGEVPERAELEKEMSEASAKKPPPFPYVDRAPTGRARCIGCHEAIAKDAPRVAIERDIDRGMSVVKGAGYLHPGCAAKYVEEQGGAKDQLVTELRANTRVFEGADLDAVLAQI